MEYLTRPVYGPDGALTERGAAIPAAWDDEFVADLAARGALASDTDHPLLAVPLDNDTAITAAWADPALADLDDPVVATAVARIRLAARDAGLHDIARDRELRRLPLSGTADRSVAATATPGPVTR